MKKKNAKAHGKKYTLTT